VRRAGQAWLHANPQGPGLDVVFEVVAISGRHLERLRLDPDPE
jgi:hypothetical protein